MKNIKRFPYILILILDLYTRSQKTLFLLVLISSKIRSICCFCSLYLFFLFITIYFFFFVVVVAFYSQKLEKAPLFHWINTKKLVTRMHIILLFFFALSLYFHNFLLGFLLVVTHSYVTITL